MSKSYKKKIKKEDEVVVDENSLSKKELYDLNKMKKDNLKIKEEKNKNKKKTRRKANLPTRIFAIAMLVLMIASVIVSAVAYLGY